MINYAEQFQKLTTSGESDFWNPEAGQYKVKALNDLYEIDPYEDETGKKDRVALDIEISGNKKIWTMGVGKTLASTYGQLVNLGKESGTLNGKEFTVVVKNDGKRNSYTIVV